MTNKRKLLKSMEDWWNVVDPAWRQYYFNMVPGKKTGQLHKIGIAGYYYWLEGGKLVEYPKLFRRRKK